MTRPGESSRGTMWSGQRCSASTASDAPSATCPSASMIRIFIKIRLWGLPILFSLVIVLLPSSETKHTGGDGPPLRLGALSFPALRSLRAELVDELATLAADPPACRRALGLSASQDHEIERNAALLTAPTMPAIHRYTGTPAYCTTHSTSNRSAAQRFRVHM